MRTCWMFALAFLATAALAEEPPNCCLTTDWASVAAASQPRDPKSYTRLLLPFHENVSGGAGVWGVNWWIHNDDDVPADVFPLAISAGLPPPPSPGEPKVFMLGNPAIAPHSTPHGWYGDALPTYASPPEVPVVTNGTGAFLYAETARLSRIAIGGSIQFRTGPVTLLDAIAETSFVRGANSILPIPLRNGWRYALRIYALPETATDPRLTVRVYEMQPLSLRADEVLVSEKSVSVIVPDSHVRPCSNSCDVPSASYAPASVQIFDVAKRDPAAALSTIRVEIAPQSAEMKWWALVSGTDNISQGVTLYELRR